MLKAVIGSPVATQSGYGHHAREIITNIIERKDSEWDIKLLSMPWGNTPFTYPISDDLKRRIIPLPLQQQPDIWIQITVPNEFQPVGKVNIGVTAGTEGDVCPADWIDKINQMQITIVPSNFTKQVFVNTAKQHNKAITTDLQVIPEYFDATIYNNQNVTETITELDQIPESFVYLTVGHWLQGSLGEDRKNISGTLFTFFDTFKNKKSMPALVLKSSGATYSIMDRVDIESRINQVAANFKGSTLPNVYLLHGDLTDAEMNALYNHPKIKAMYSLTKAEGFGRPLLEFSTTGKPIIAPHYSGQADFLNSEFIVEIKGGLTPIHPSAQNPFLIGEAKWFSPDYRQVCEVLETVYEKYKNYTDIGKRQRYHAIKSFTKEAVNPKYDSLITAIDVYANQIPKQVELKLPQLKKIELPKLQKV